MKTTADLVYLITSIVLFYGTYDLGYLIEF